MDEQQSTQTVTNTEEVTSTYSELSDKCIRDMDVVPERLELFESIGDAVKGFKPFLTQKYTVDSKMVSFEYNGRAQFLIGDTTYLTTEWGLLSLCKIFKIPNPFMRHIPMDLLKRNIDRLALKFDGELILSLDPEGTIVGFTLPKYKPIVTFDLLSRLDEEFKDVSNVTVILTSKDALIQFTSARFPIIEPKEGDIIRSGLEIVTSEVMSTESTAQLFIYRLASKTGALMTENWGRIRRNRKKKLDDGARLSQFVAGCIGFETNVADLLEVFSAMGTMSLSSDDFVKIYRGLSSVLGPEETQKLLQVDKEAIEEYVVYEKQRTRWSANPSRWYGHQARDTEHNAYDTFTNIMDYSREIKDYRQSRRLRAVSGKMIFILSQKLRAAKEAM